MIDKKKFFNNPPRNVTKILRDLFKSPKNA